MKLVTAEEMGRIEMETEAELGYERLVMMELAGRALAECCLMEGKPCRGGVILAGSGNNGGDGLVAARHLINAGMEVEVFLSHPVEALKGLSAVNARILRGMGLKFHLIEDSEALDRALGCAAWIVDALWGTGFRGETPQGMAEVIGKVNASKAHVISADLPSGLDADTGMTGSVCIKADTTVTFGLPKRGLVLGKGPVQAGTLLIADIGIPRNRLADPRVKCQLIRDEILIPRDFDSHKGHFGHALVLGGTLGMTGAAVLAGQAVLRSGAALVTLGVPKAAQPVAAAALPEAMTQGWPGHPDGGFAKEAVEWISPTDPKIDVVAIGPGMGKGDGNRALIEALLEENRQPMVIDADGLNAIAGRLMAVEESLVKQGPVPVLTPHPGEMSRMTGLETSRIQKDRLGVAERFARRWGAIVVLKGAHTVVASPDGHLYVNRTGNPGMATAGAGDTLTGLIAGFIAQGHSPLEAAIKGVFFHGLAGDIAATKVGQNALTSGDLIRFLPEALRSGRQMEKPIGDHANCFWSVL